MGIPMLWELMSPTCEKSVPLNLFGGQIIAIDLSVWINEFRYVSNKQSLRESQMLTNLFHRTSELMKYGLKLVFITDGKAPAVKAAAMRQRKQASSKNTEDINVDLQRTGFNQTISECTKLLECMGLPCISSDGEAEAYCAGLNREGLVDAVITEDSDVFLYGVQKVYCKLEKKRNVYHVDVYKMEKIKEQLHLDRESLIAMALFIGCDYDEGIKGIGLEKAKTLIEELRKNGYSEPLQRITDWRINKELDELELWKKTKKSKKKDDQACVCSTCKKSDSQKSDDDSLCTCSCIKCRSKQYKQHRLEIKYRAMALKKTTFPCKEVIDEFRKGSKIEIAPKLEWGQIKVQKLISVFQTNNCTWKEMYKHVGSLIVVTQMSESADTVLKPLRIVKSCKRKDKPCLEVEWEKFDCDRTTTVNFYSVIVTRDQFKSKYPEMLEEYDEEHDAQRNAKRKGKKRKMEEKPDKTIEKPDKTMTDFFKIKKTASSKISSTKD